MGVGSVKDVNAWGIVLVEEVDDQRLSYNVVSLHFYGHSMNEPKMRLTLTIRKYDNLTNYLNPSITKTKNYPHLEVEDVSISQASS